MLRPGARIAVVSPSGIYDPQRLERGMALVREWGYQLVRSPNLGATHRYTAGSVDQRARDLSWALTAPAVEAVWFARGGYGTVHLLDRLPWGRLDRRPVIGFSDATALFTAMSSRGAGRAIHGPVLHSLADHVDAASRARLRDLLRGEAAVHLPGHHLVGPRDPVEGVVVGGNLCVLASLAGTPWALRAEGAIVLLEDLAEPPYKLDRMVTQLRLSGALDGVRGVALGEFIRCDGPGYGALDVLADLLAPLGVPVVAGLPVGHGPTNHAWVHGATGRLHSEGLDVGAG